MANWMIQFPDYEDGDGSWNSVCLLSNHLTWLVQRMEMVLETLFVCRCNHLTWLMAWENLLHSPWKLQIVKQILYSMEQSPSWEANRFAASQEIPRILWKPEGSLLQSPVPILSQLDPVHTSHPTFWRSILILSSHLRLGLPRGLFPSGFPTKTLYTPLPSPMPNVLPISFILISSLAQ